MRRPTHPGEILKEDILPNTRIPVSMLARLLRISRQQLHRILIGEGPVTPDTAVKLAALFKNDPQFWLNLQAKFDIWRSSSKLAREIEILGQVKTNDGSSGVTAALEQLAPRHLKIHD